MPSFMCELPFEKNKQTIELLETNKLNKYFDQPTDDICSPVFWYCPLENGCGIIRITNIRTKKGVCSVQN